MGEYFMNRIFFCLILVFSFLNPATGFADDDSLYIEKYFQLLSQGTGEEKKIALFNLPRLLNDPKYKNNPATVNLVLDALKDNDPSIREATAAFLKVFGKITKGRCEKNKIVDSLVKALADIHPGVRREAVKALVFYNDTRASDPLIDILKRDPDPWVRLEAAYALGQLNSRKALPALLDALKDNNTDWRNKIFLQECVIALRNIGYRDTESIQLFMENADDAYLKAEIIKSLGQFRAMDAKDILLQATQDPESIIRELALRAIDRLPLVRTRGMDSNKHPKCDLFTKLLKQDPSPGVRAIAAEALGRTGDIRAVRPIIHALDDNDRTVQKQAIAALAFFEDERIFFALIPFFGTSLKTYASTTFLTVAKNTAGKTVFVYKNEGGHHAATSLSEIPRILKENKPWHSPQSIEKLIQDYPTPAEKQLQDTPMALRKISQKMSYDRRIIHPNAVSALILGLKHDDPAVKTATLEILHEFEDDRIEAVLIDLLYDEPVNIRNAAMSQWELHFITQRSLTSVLNILNDGDGYMRAKAARLLGILKDKRAIQPLVKKLDDDAPEVRGAALGSLQNFNDPQILDATIRMLDDDNEGVRALAKTSLRNFGGPRALDETIRMLGDESVNVRKTAVINIKMRPDPKAVDPLIYLLAGPGNDELAAQKAYARATERFGVQSVPKLDAKAIGALDLKAAEAAYMRAEKKIDIQKIRELEILAALSAFYQAALLKEQELDVLAADALGVIGDNRAVDPLIMALNGQYGQNPELMVTAARILSSFEEKRIMPHLVKNVGRAKKKESDLSFLIPAKRVLNRYEDQERVNVLRHYLNDTDKEIQKGAVFLLAMYQGEMAVPDFKVLLDDPDPELKGYTREIVAGIKSGSYQQLKKEMEVTTIVQGLKPVYAYPVPENKSMPLSKNIIHQKLYKQVEKNNSQQQGSGEIKTSGIIGASARKEQNIEKHLELLEHGSKIERRTALEVIPEFIGIPEYRKNPKIIDPILEALIDKDQFIRQAAAGCLEKIGEKTRHVIDESKVVPALIMALVDENADVRIRAARALAIFQNEPAIDPLIERVYDEDFRVRYEAVVSLSRLKAGKAIPALLDMLNDNTDWDQKSLVRNECLSAIRKTGRYPAQSVPLLMAHFNDATLKVEVVKALGRCYSSDPSTVRDLLIQASKDPDEEVRKSAFAVMAKSSPFLGRNTAKDESLDIDQYIRSLKDPSPEVRKASVTALAKTGNAKAIELLINALHDRDAEVQKAAVGAMGKFKNERILRELAPFLGAQAKDLRVTAMDSFLNAARNTIKHKVYVYRENGNLYTVKSRKEVPEKLSFTDRIVHPDAVDILIDVLNSEDPSSRLGAFGIIREFSDDRIEQELIKHLDDSSSKVRLKNLILLHDFATSRAVPDVADALSDQDPGVRKKAGWLLGVIKSRQAVTPLLKGLSDTHPDVKCSVIFALGQIKDRRAVDPLIDNLSDCDPMIRKAALYALVNFDDPLISDLSIKMLNDESPDVRNTAISNIQKKPDKRAVEPLICFLEDPDSNCRAAAALGIIGDQKAVDPLIRALNRTCSRGVQTGPDRGFALSAVNALGRLGGEKAVEAILTVAESDLQNTHLKKMAIESLGDIGDKSVTEPLINILMDEQSDMWLRAGAASALGEIGDERAVDPLLKSSNDLSDILRHDAEEALKKMEKLP